MASSIRKIGVLGAGVIGASWTALFIARGYEVYVCDVQPTAGDFVLDYVKKAWPLLQKLDLVVPGASPEKFTFSTELATAFANVDFVQENSPERIEIKHSLLEKLDASIPPHAIIASSSSGLTCSEMQKTRLQHPERLCIGHPFNPPHFIPLVEVVGGQKTSESTKQIAMDFYTLIGKKPILLQQEVNGHVANRLQSALFREIFHLMSEDVASISEIETAMEYGPGLRWGAMGPSTIFSLGGGAGGIHHFAEHLLPYLLSWYAPKDPVLDEASKAKWVEQTTAAIGGRKAEELIQERDDIIAGILKAKQNKV
jgi:3-hydroxyacyl-CoA dehydrogenase